MDVHSKSSSSFSENDKSYEHLAMCYNEFDVMFKDINEEKLEKIGHDQEIEHLGLSTFVIPAFPVNGRIHGPNSRFMVPLVFQRAQKPNSKVVNVWCLLDIGCPFTCLTVKTLEVFFGAGNVVDGRFYSFAIQDPNSNIECQVSKVGTHFEHVNILGTDALRKLKLTFDVNWDLDTFKLIKK